MTHRERTDKIADEAAAAARMAAEEAKTPEARFFLRQHALLLERLARGKRSAGRTRDRALSIAPLVGIGLPL